MTSWGDQLDEKFDPSVTPDFGDGSDHTPPGTPKTSPSTTISSANDTIKADEVKAVAEKLKSTAIDTTGTPSNGGHVPISLKDKQKGHIDWEGEVYTQQHDPNSPIYSKLKDFTELNLSEQLLQGVYAMGFTKPSKIQETALPMIVFKPFRDLIAQSQSGTGKTAAFVLGMLCRVDHNKQCAQAICLSPTRELARQTAEVLQTMAKYTPVKCLIAVPGVELPPRGSKVSEQIIIGTPGTIMSMIRGKNVDTRQIIVLVFDEADDMWQRGFRDDSVRIKKSLTKDHQTLLFSATYPPDVRKFVEHSLRGANEVRLKKKDLTLDGITQYWIDCRTPEERYSILADIYGAVSLGQVIIFCDQTKTAQTLSDKMTADGHSVSVLYSGSRERGNYMTAQDRDRVIDDFRDSKTKVLITTNVLARGIDIDQVNVVINYDIPVVHHTGKADTDTYLHRIGRTGRFGRKGLSINFCYDERSRRLNQDIANFFEKPIVRVPTEDPEEFDKMLVI
eukprot:CFRG4697T1